MLCSYCRSTIRVQWLDVCLNLRPLGLLDHFKIIRLLGNRQFLEAEFDSAITRKIRTGEIRKADGNRILAMFSSHPEADLFTFV